VEKKKPSLTSPATEANKGSGAIMMAELNIEKFNSYSEEGFFSSRNVAVALDPSHLTAHT
jgi:hypothetical protein